MFVEFPDNPDDPNSKNSRLLKQSIDNAIRTKKIDFLDVIRYDLPIPEEKGGGFTYDYWEATHTPVLDDNGNVDFIIQVTNKVTERELAKQALTESESNFRFMAESMPQLIWTANADGKVVYMNRKWIDYTGLNQEELHTGEWGRIVHWDDVESARVKWEEAIKHKDEYQAQYRLRDKDGCYRWFLARGVPRKDDNGNVQMWVGSATDIHDTKMLVDELLSSNEKMTALSDQVQDAYEKAENERQTLERLIMEAPAMMCILKGPDHKYEIVNPMYQSVFPDRELLGKTVAEAIPETVEQGFIKLLDNVYQNGETFVGEELLLRFKKEDTGKMEDGYFTITYQPLYEANKIAGIMVFAINVTDAVRLKKKLAELEDK